MEIATTKEAVQNEMIQLKAAGYDYQVQMGNIEKRITQLQLILNLCGQSEREAEAATVKVPAEPAK